jgi:hypothetical protein
MKQLNIIGIGSTPARQPEIATAYAFVTEVQTKEGTALFTATFEAAKELKNELEKYLDTFRDR